MAQKKVTPIEISRLFNPSFCGQILLHCIDKYQKFIPEGLPYPLIFFILPMILHQDTRSRIPSITKSTFHMWLTKNQPILIDLPTRIRNLVAITKESLVFLIFLETISIDSGKIQIKIFKPQSKESESLEIQDCYKKAEVLGKWLALGGTPSTIFSMLGVTP